MKFISLFAGIGGFDLALTRNGHECVWVNEWDKYASQIYDKNFRTKSDTRDIRTVSTEEIPDHDILVGGFPCQAFSIAGKRGGFDDTRGTLFYEIARILREKHTRLFILENVKGLLSHDNGNTFKTIISTFVELGYDLQWQVLNSKNFGVPQNRERVFIIGNLRGTTRPEIFPIRESNEKNDLQINILGHKDCYRRANQIFDPSGITETLSTCGGEGQHPCTVALTEKRSEKAKQIRKEMRAKGKDWSPRREKELVARADGLMGTLTSSRNMENIIAKTVRVGGGGSPFGSKQNWDSYKIEGKIRRLTPLECERLQGFPDNWTEGVSNTQRYKMCGNAVTVNVVEYLVSKLK